MVQRLKVIIVLLTFLSIGCSKKESESIFPFPDFKFGTRVIVVSGFYKNQKGTVVGYTKNYSTDCSKGYKVKFDSTLIEKPQFICNGDLNVIK